WTGYPSDLVRKEGVFSQWETQFPLYRDNGTLFNLRVCAVSEYGQSGSGVINSNNGDIIGILVGGCPQDGSLNTVFTLLRGANYTFVSDEVFGR
ncbi:hypothetical protein, partial [Bacillus mycoides]|uniref:hypothetical protein n=1 Tax=Bacillus mycoides TaxID=1405 RepID=UPI0019D625D6